MATLHERNTKALKQMYGYRFATPVELRAVVEAARSRYDIMTKRLRVMSAIYMFSAAVLLITAVMTKFLFLVIPALMLIAMAQLHTSKKVFALYERELWAFTSGNFHVVHGHLVDAEEVGARKGYSAFVSDSGPDDVFVEMKLLPEYDEPGTSMLLAVTQPGVLEDGRMSYFSLKDLSEPYAVGSSFAVPELQSKINMIEIR